MSLNKTQVVAVATACVLSFLRTQQTPKTHRLSAGITRTGQFLRQRWASETGRSRGGPPSGWKPLCTRTYHSETVGLGTGDWGLGTVDLTPPGLPRWFNGLCGTQAFARRASQSRLLRESGNSAANRSIALTQSAGIAMDHTSKCQPTQNSHRPTGTTWPLRERKCVKYPDSSRQASPETPLREDPRWFRSARQGGMRVLFRRVAGVPPLGTVG